MIARTPKGKRVVKCDTFRCGSQLILCSRRTGSDEELSREAVKRGWSWSLDEEGGDLHLCPDCKETQAVADREGEIP